ncbi:metal ABC transporter ATP-binding protein [Calditerrivibrio nitroreducens]|uniref:ABC transporter related protein n=1 Tax=Calditerrivibrio nitroreducens (strain DSM 19672 / NBRC 101217 / Yu37-1) TaxID=768670 RepID=E4TGS9_CALNY|nr:metal ABC transporter ATP-binding protein [Calditerrivibrio nitroreducens]ADR18689.1 ABC transporter related protein [Calditerrivibrio nitroreducens DSM 19672]
MKTVVDLQNIYFRYDNEDFWILEDVNLTVKEGDYLIIVGPNGGGKTTLIKVMLGLLSPTKGAVNLNIKHSEIGYLPQYISLKRDFPIKVRDVILLGLPKGKAFSNEYFDEIVNELKIGDLLHKKVSELSGGQLQRVLLARAVISRPGLLILDEPTSNIDPYGTFCFFSYLEKLNKDMTIVMVTHNLGLIMSGVKSVACVNRKLIFMNKPQINQEMIELMYGVHDQHSCHLGQYLHDEIAHISRGGVS